MHKQIKRFGFIAGYRAQIVREQDPVNVEAAERMCAIQFRRRRSIEQGKFPAWVVIIYVVSIFVVAALWINVAGTLFPSTGGPYAVALTWALCIFGFIFVRTIELFLHRGPHA